MPLTNKETTNVILEGIETIMERKIQDITDLKVKCGEITQQIQSVKAAITRLERLKDEVLNGEV